MLCHAFFVFFSLKIEVLIGILPRSFLVLSLCWFHIVELK